MQKVNRHIEVKELVSAEVYESEKGIKLFILQGAKEWEVSEYFTGRQIAWGDTMAQAKKNAEEMMTYRKIIDQDDMEIYIEERSFKSINK